MRGKRKGNTRVALAVPLPVRFSRKEKKRGERQKSGEKRERDRPRGAGPCTRHPFARFSRNHPVRFYECRGERRDGTRRAFRIAQAVVARARPASCTYLPGTCTTLFTTRSYTPSLPHGAIVLKIKKCVSASEGKKLGSSAVVVALSGPGERYSPFFPPPLQASPLSLLLLLLPFSPSLSLPARASERRSQPAPA